MQILKYFYEEPAAMELLTPDEMSDAREPAELRTLEAFLSGPRYYRGYLAGSDLESGGTGASVLDPAAIRRVLESALQVPVKRLPTDGAYATGPHGLDRIELPDDTRRALQLIREVLDTGRSVLKSEPAPDGVDWSVFSARPMADDVRAALRENSRSAPRCFAIPYREARGEHRFYFERHDLGLFEMYEI